MIYPGVYIEILNGQLGVVPTTDDGIAGMIVSGIDDGNVPMAVAKQIFSLKEAEDLGIDEAYDNANSVYSHAQIKTFYEQAGNGAELWIMIIPTTVTMADMVDVTKTYAPALLDAAQGKIRILAVSRIPDAGYTATITHGVDDDVWNAMANAQLLAEEYATQIKPLRVIVGARAWNGVIADLQDLTELTNNRVGISLIGIADGIAENNSGYILGRLASIPVQRNIARVKDGAVVQTTAYFSDGSNADDFELQAEAINAKGYLAWRKYVGRGGFFFIDDHAATTETDDYHSLARGRVIDKALVLTYVTYIDEVNDEVIINPDGTLSAAYVKALQSKVENVINGAMTADQEISSAKCTIDPNQNILSTNKLDIELLLVPVGYAKEINVKLGFTNPALNQ